AITPAPGFEGAQNLNPQWAADGASLYFLSDQNGIMNVYRLDTASGVLSQVTNLYTGVSGITNLSPALSTASHSPRVAFHAYEDGKYNIYAVDDPERLAGHEPNRSTAAASPALLPPQDRGQEAIPQLLADADTGLPPVRPIPPEGYRAKLTLDY